MEKRISVENTTKMAIYVGSNVVPPGETRDFPESMVPHHLRPTPTPTPPPPGLPLSGEEQGAPADQLAVLLEGNVKEVIAALPGLALADLERLGELEQAGQARKGVLGAIADAQLSRAELADHAASLSDDGLAAALEDVGTDINADPELVAALEAEAAKRNPETVE